MNRIQNSFSVARLVCVGLSLACTFFNGNLPVRAADPKPDAPFGTLGKIGYTPEEAELHEKLVACDAEIRSTIEKIMKGRAPVAKDVSRLYVAVERYRRWISALRCYRSSAATDFYYREGEYGKVLTQTLTRFWGTPPAAGLQQKVLQQLGKSHKRRLQQLEKIYETLETGNAESAEQMIDKLVDDVYASAGILTPKQKEPVSIPIQKVEGPVRQEMGKIRREKAQQALTAEVKKRTASSQQLVADIQAASSSGSVDVDGQQLMGPEAVEHFIKRWRMAHVEMLRAVELSRANAAGVFSGGFDRGMGAGSSTVMSSSDTQEFTGAMLQAIGNFVAKDVAATSEADALAKHEQYTKLLGQIALFTEDQSWLPKMDLTIAPLTSKAGLESTWRAYSDATNDLLRWRARAADAATKAKGAPTPADIARQKLTTEGKVVGMYTKDNQELPWMQKPVPSLVPDVDKALKGAEVRVASTIALSSNNPIWMSRVEDGFYSRLTQGIQDPKQHESLAKDLLVDGGKPPLTLASAAALASSMAGRYEAVGGQIESFAVEGATPRFAAMPTVAADLIPYGAAQPQAENVHPAAVLTFRLDLKPTWFQHQYYFSTGQ